MTTAFRCPVCDASDVKRLRGYRNTSPSSTIFDDLTIYRCLTCALGFAYPRPPQSALTAYYATGYRTSSSLPPWPHRVRNLARARSQLLYLEQVISLSGVTNWLDVGAGFGLLLDEVRQAGIHTAAIEPEPFARKRLLDVGHQLFESMEAAGSQSWDVVSFSHVLEHVSQPLHFLQGIYEALRPGGYALCEVPNEIGLMQSTSDFPHLHFFQAGSLQKSFEDCGFVLLRAGSCGDVWNKNQSRRLMRLIIHFASRCKRHPPLWLTRHTFKHFQCSDSFDRKWLRIVAQKPPHR